MYLFTIHYAVPKGRGAAYRKQVLVWAESEAEVRENFSKGFPGCHIVSIGSNPEPMTTVVRPDFQVDVYGEAARLVWKGYSENLPSVSAFTFGCPNALHEHLRRRAVAEAGYFQELQKRSLTPQAEAA